MLRLLTSMFLLALAVVASPSQAAAFSHAGWDALLKMHVHVLRSGQETQVDYARFQIDRAVLKRYLDGDTLKVSRIFTWYWGDFEKAWMGATRLEQFLALYAPALGLSAEQVKRLAAGDITIGFLDYDWHLNAAKEHA